MYLATQMINEKEKAELHKLFVSMDKNADGKLSREELIKGYSNLSDSAADIEEKVDQIMANVDVDHNGYIDYSEFVIALTNKRKLLSTENLKQAFSMFDRDGSGLITADEIKMVLGVGKKFSESVWEAAVKEVDQNSDGKISFEEFEMMMNRFITNE